MGSFRYGFGFVPNYRVALLGTGGGIPFPSSGNVGYYTPFDITKLGFSSANNVNLVVDQSTAGNNLTQGTASANMTLEEHDTVTQFTSANQPTLKYDAEVSQDSSANQPTLVDTGGGELAMEFDESCVNGLNMTNSWAIEFVDLSFPDIANNTAILGNGSNGLASVFQLAVNSSALGIYDNSGIYLGSISGFSFVKDTKYNLKISYDGSSFIALVDDVMVGSPLFRVTDTRPSSIGNLLSASGRTLMDIGGFNQWNNSNYTGTPDFELIPTIDSCNVAVGQQVSRWNATSHRAFKNRLLSDGSNDNYDGLPTQSGDFTYVFKCEFDALSTTDYLLSDTGDSAWLLLSDNLLYLRDTTGANDIALTGHTIESGDHVYIISREGDDLKYYVDSNLKQTVDVTGRTFTFSRVGATADSLKALNAEWGVWNRAFTQDDVDYFSYLRDDDTNAILQPPLTPAP